MKWWPLLFLGLALSACATQLRGDVKDTLYPDELEGIRWGLLVTDLEGKELLAMRPDDRFIPASNTKLVTTAAGFSALPILSASADRLSTRIYIEETPRAAPPHLLLVGRGDPMVGDGEACEERCLKTLADAVVAAGIKTVGDVIGDDRWFPDERTPPGWSHEDLRYGYGTTVSALTVSSNIVMADLQPPVDGDSNAMLLTDADERVLDIKNEVGISDKDDTRLRRAAGDGASEVRLYGELSPADLLDEPLEFGLSNPAVAAAERLAAHLRALGVTITGDIRARHRDFQLVDKPQPEDPESDDRDAVACTPLPLHDPALEGYRELASLPSPDYGVIFEEINKESQNLHAELVVRQLGRLTGSGASACGLIVLRDVLAAAGAPRTSYDLADGSGMSVYNRLSPRALVSLLLYASNQPWGAAYRESLPIGGVDGTLEKRFIGTPLEGRIFAKTGTLSGVNALSGYMIADSGRMLAFSVIANDRPWARSSATRLMDAALLRIAAAH